MICLRLDVRQPYDTAMATNVNEILVPVEVLPAKRRDTHAVIGGSGETAAGSISTTVLKKDVLILEEGRRKKKGGAAKVSR